MGITKTRDGRYLVGQGVTDGNEYKGSLAWRDIVIQLSADGATAESIEKLEFLRDYGLYHSGEGNSVMPPSVSVWISNNGTTTAVEADDITVDGSNYTICGIKWNGSAWDFSQAGQGGGGGGLPPYTSADKGKVLTVVDAEPETVIVVPEQSGICSAISIAGGTAYGIILQGVDTSSLKDGDTVLVGGSLDGQPVTAQTKYNAQIESFIYNNLVALIYKAQLVESGETVWVSDNHGSSVVGLPCTVSATASVHSVEPKWEAGSFKIIGRASGSDTGVWNARQECKIGIPSSFGVDNTFALMNVDVTVNEKSYHVDYLSPHGDSVTFDDLPAGIGGVEVFPEAGEFVTLVVSCFAGEPAAESINVSAEFTVYTLSDMLALLFT